MRLYELKKKRKKSHTELTWGDVERLIVKDCSDILGLYKANKKVFYRGTRKRHPEIFKGASITGRRPADTPKPVQRKVDQMLKALGFKALRSNSIFVTPMKINAEEYSVDGGDGVYVIFPINGFKYTWSEHVGDMFGYFADEMGSKLEHWLLNAKVNPKSLKQFQEYFGYTNKHLDQALDHHSEVMISGQYYAVDVDVAYDLLKDLAGFEI